DGEKSEAKETKARSKKEYGESEVDREEGWAEAQSGAQAGRSQAARSRDTGCAGQPKRPDGAVEASRAHGGCGSGRRGLRRSFRGWGRGFRERGRIARRRAGGRGGN